MIVIAIFEGGTEREPTPRKHMGRGQITRSGGAGGGAWQRCIHNIRFTTHRWVKALALKMQLLNARILFRLLLLLAWHVKSALPQALADKKTPQFVALRKARSRPPR